MEEYKLFVHKDCEFYPCHKLADGEVMNCLFCYCPFMFRDCRSFGNPTDLEVNGKVIKDCSNCTFPHKPENYDKMMDLLIKEIYG